MLNGYADCPFAPPHTHTLWSSFPLHPCPLSLSPLLDPRLNVLKRRCELTVVISHHALTVLCVTCVQYTLDRSMRGHYESPHLGGPADAQPFRDLQRLSCMILVVHSGFVCTHICASSGLWPQYRQSKLLDLCASAGSVSRPLSINSTRGTWHSSQRASPCPLCSPGEIQQLIVMAR